MKFNQLQYIVPLLSFFGIVGIITYSHYNNKQLPIPAVERDYPVVLELFTSQGCADCPSAEATISQIKHYPNVVTLCYPVTYWNKLGWVDRFSRRDFDEYQTAYNSKFELNNYTPQVVVNGMEEFSGNDIKKLNTYLNNSHQIKKITTPIVKRKKNHLDITYDLSNVEDYEDAHLALLLEEQTTLIDSGENEGNELHQTHIVLYKERIGTIDKKGQSSIDIPNRFPLTNSYKIALIVKNINNEIIAATISNSI